jgi:hypothetical protein
MTTYAKILRLPNKSFDARDANAATLEEVEIAEAIMPDLAAVCHDMSNDPTPLQMIPLLMIKMEATEESDVLTFTYQLAGLFHYLEGHTRLAQENYQWCAAVLERACVSDTDYREVEEKMATRDYSGWRAMTFKEMDALDKMCPYMIDLAARVFDQYNKWI